MNKIVLTSFSLITLFACANDYNKHTSLSEISSNNEVITPKDTTSKLQMDIKSKKFDELLNFNEFIPDWTDADINAKKNRKAVPFNVKSSEIKDNILVVELYGIQGYGKYNGNAKIEGDLIKLYYWIDNKEESAHHLSQFLLRYEIDGTKISPDYKIDIVFLK